MANKKLYLPSEMLPDLDAQDFYHHEVIGFDIEDQNRGNIGTIADIVESNTNPIFKIDHPNGEEVLLPVADEFIVNVDKENQKIIVNCPEGLIDLYLNE